MSEEITTFPETADPQVVKAIVDFVKDPSTGVVFNREERMARRNAPIYDNLKEELGVDVEKETDGDEEVTTDFDGSELDDADDEDESWLNDEDESDGSTDVLGEEEDEDNDDEESEANYAEGF